MEWWCRCCLIDTGAIICSAMFFSVQAVRCCAVLYAAGGNEDVLTSDKHCTVATIGLR